MGPGAHHDVGGLDADDQVVITHVFDEVYLIQGALHDTLCGDAVVFFHQFFFQGTAVDAHADGDVTLLRSVYYGLYTFPASDIARVDADLVRAVLDGRQGQLIIKMNVRHQRNRNLLLNLAEGLRRLHGRNRAADNVAACRRQRLNLGHGSLHILCLCIGHGLDQDRIASSDDPVADFNNLRMLSHVLLPPVILFPF